MNHTTLEPMIAGPFSLWISTNTIGLDGMATGITDQQSAIIAWLMRDIARPCPTEELQTITALRSPHGTGSAWWRIFNDLNARLALIGAAITLEGGFALLKAGPHCAPAALINGARQSGIITNDMGGMCISFQGTTGFGRTLIEAAQHWQAMHGGA